MSAFGAVPGLAVYAATKHAVLAFTVSLQGDLDHAGIPVRAHAVCPDGVDTAMVHERAADPESAIIFSAPRLLDPDEVAEQAVALLDGRRLIAAIPRSRAWLGRLLYPFPRAYLRALELFRRAGERKRRRAAAGAKPATGTRPTPGEPQAPA
jgi:short-subunit dehydrogenase